MIRIDLKKGDSGGPAKSPIADAFAQFEARVPIPPKVKEFTSDVRNLILLAIVVSLSALPYLFFTQYQAFVESQHRKAISALNLEVEKMNLEVNKLMPFQREMQSYDNQKKLVAERLGVVNRLLTTRTGVVPVLDAVGQSLPQRVWIEELTLNLKEVPPQVTAEGFGYTHEDISDFIEKISESRFLADVVLEDVAGAVNTGQEVKGFKVRMVPRGTGLAPTPPPPAEGGAGDRAVAEEVPGSSEAAK